jgi:hypothetical protein
MRRRLKIAGIAAAAVILLLVILPLPYERTIQIDAFSARERVVHRVFGVPYVSHHPSMLGDFAERHLQPLAEPRWHSFHYWSPFDPVRISYRYGRLRANLRDLEFAFEVSDMGPNPAPLETRIAILRAALAELAAERGILVDLDHPSGSFEVRAEDGRLLGGHDATIPPAKAP